MKDLTLVGCTSSTVYTANAHFHNMWEFIYYTKGSGYLLHGDGGYFDASAFSVNDIAIVPPYKLHYDKTEEGYQNFIILFNYSNRDPNRVQFCRDGERNIFPLVEMLYSQFYSQHLNRQKICEAVLYLIEQCIISKDMEIDEHKSNDVVSGFIDVLNRNFSSQTFCLQNALDDIGYSDDYFRKLFKRETGKSPFQYLSHLRINFARQLLEDSTLPVREIALMSGFSDPYFFSRQFKIVLGKSPKEWRNNNHHLRKTDTESVRTVAHTVSETPGILQPIYNSATTFTGNNTAR